MWKRFPIPEFDRAEFKDLGWAAPAYLSQADIGKLIDGRKSGDSSVYGCYPVMPDEAFFAKLDVRGDQRHAVMCVLPDQDVRIVGRSWAWATQRAWIVDSLEPNHGEGVKGDAGGRAGCSRHRSTTRTISTTATSVSSGAPSGEAARREPYRH